jgi:hypothetical protein
MPNTITLTPAYGRDYTTAQLARKSFESWQDCVVSSIHTYSGRYCSIRDLAGYNVTLRYNRNADCCVVKLKPKTDVGAEVGAQAHRVHTDTHMYCTKCNRNLLTVKAGSYAFDDLTSLCDCSWRCCDHSKSGPGKHSTHLEHRPANENTLG